MNRCASQPILVEVAHGLFTQKPQTASLGRSLGLLQGDVKRRKTKTCLTFLVHLLCLRPKDASIADGARPKPRTCLTFTTRRRTMRP